MTKPIYNKFFFKRVDGALVSRPRTHHDLKSGSVYLNAADAGLALRDEVVAVREYVVSLDQTDLDHNKKAGQVLLKGAPYQGGELEGHYFPSSSHLVKSLEVAVMQGGERTEYVEDTQFSTPSFGKTSHAGTRRATEESFKELDTWATYDISGPSEENPFSDFHHQDIKLPRPKREKKKRVTGLRTDVSGYILDQNPAFLKDLEELKTRQEAVETGREVKKMLDSVYEAAQALDQSKADLNPREGEVLFENMEVLGRKISGTILPLGVSGGESPGGFVSSAPPYLRTLCPETGETFELIDGKNDEFDGYYHSVDKSYIYDNGEKRVRVDLDMDDGRVTSATVNESSPPKTLLEKLQFCKS